MSTTPQAGLGMGTIMVGTPGSKSDTPPPAESTRKTAMQQLGPDLGESYIQPKPGPMPRVGIVTGTPDTTANTPSSYQPEYMHRKLLTLLPVVQYLTINMRYRVLNLKIPHLFIRRTLRNN